MGHVRPSLEVRVCDDLDHVSVPFSGDMDLL